MDIRPGTSIKGFTVTSEESLSEIDGTAYVMKHETSGAKLLYLKNEDNNKAFSIAFKTPPTDSTGVFHILEHSVLCGSKKFPVKEPFVNLIKSSMQTFLNAMTFPDKTMYPVASTNEQDLLNLMDVYLDAVLHPAIYDKKAIFEQEGWHYEIDSETDELSYNGVVFNEMKGALSDPDSVLYNALSAELFPDTFYQHESGGDPNDISTLSYEQFIEAHQRYYRLDNSYITLYGNVDIQKVLSFLDDNYLSKAERRTHSDKTLTFTPQSPVISLNNEITMQTAKENATAGFGFVVGSAMDREKNIAADILLDALMGSNESPLKRVLLDSGLSGDVDSYLIDSMLQPVLIFQLKNSKENVLKPFHELLTTSIQELCESGIPREKLEASLSRAEFIIRERDFGTADGVILAMQSLSGWLYSDEMATTYLRYEDTFERMREKIDEGYFEALLKELLLENDHMASVELKPIQDKTPSRYEKRLAEKKKDLSDLDKKAINAEVEELRRLQEEPDAPEDLATLPLLHISDLADSLEDPDYEYRDTGSLPCLYHNIPSRHINYVYHYFDLNHLSFSDLPYVSILTMLLGKLDTDTYRAEQLDSLIQSRLGNFRVFAEIYESEYNTTAFKPKLTVSASALSHNVEDLATLPAHIWNATQFENTSKIKDILQQRKIGMDQAFITSGHTAALLRSTSYYSSAAVLRESMGGVDFYLLLKELIENFDDRCSELVAKLNELRERIFVSTDAVISFTGTPDERDQYSHYAQDYGLSALSDKSETALVIPDPHIKNEAFVVPADVCFAATGFDRRLLDNVPYSGSWQVASKVLSFDYLWNEVRVKGGAYGTGFKVGRTGGMSFYSFRDPRLGATLERFENAGSWLSSFDPSESEMRGYIISTTANHDAPKKPREIARRQDGEFFSGYEKNYRQTARAEILQTSVSTLNMMGDIITEVSNKGCRCVFGNSDILHSAENEFSVIDLIGS